MNTDKKYQLKQDYITPKFTFLKGTQVAYGGGKYVVGVESYTEQELMENPEWFEEALPEQSKQPPISKDNDWEILMIRGEGNPFPYEAHNGVFMSKEKWVQFWLSDEKYSIHSVRRISDGEVFQIGDTIEGAQIDNHNIVSHHPTKITSIRIINGAIGLSYGNGGEIVLSHAKKLPTPSPKEEDKRIEVNHFGLNSEYQFGTKPEDVVPNYLLILSKTINVDKFPAIKTAIENVLNDPAPSLQEEKKEVLPEWILDFVHQMVKDAYKKEILESESKAFYAAREYSDGKWSNQFPPPKLGESKYQTFSDYKKLNP